VCVHRVGVRPPGVADLRVAVDRIRHGEIGAVDLGHRLLGEPRPRREVHVRVQIRTGRVRGRCLSRVAGAVQRDVGGAVLARGRHRERLPSVFERSRRVRALVF